MITRNKILLSCFVIISLGLIYVRLYIGGGLAGGDSVKYYAHLQTMAINRSLDFTSAFDYFHNTKSKFTGLLKYPQLPDKHPVTNRYGMVYPIGTIVSWLPFFLLGHLLASLVFLFTHDSSLLSGFTMIHYFFTSSSALFYLLAGCYLAYNYFIKHEQVSKLVAFLSVATIALGTSLTYYVYFVPSYSHLVSFFWSTWFLTYSFSLIKEKRFSIRTLFVCGLLLAITTLTRYQDIILFLAPLYLLLSSAELSRADKLTALRSSLFAILAFCLAFIPQFLINYHLHGSFLENGYGKVGFPFLANPQFIYVLFSPMRGLFTITPIVLIAVISLCLAIKSKISQSLLVIFFTELYLISAFFGYEQGESSYGIRMLNSLAFVFMFGLIPVFNYLRQKGSWQAWLFAAFFIILNWSLMIMFALHIFGDAYNA